jgi:hypothetical protein
MRNPASWPRVAQLPLKEDALRNFALVYASHVIATAAKSRWGFHRAFVRIRAGKMLHPRCPRF